MIDFYVWLRNLWLFLDIGNPIKNNALRLYSSYVFFLHELFLCQEYLPTSDAPLNCDFARHYELKIVFLMSWKITEVVYFS